MLVKVTIAILAALVITLVVFLGVVCCLWRAISKESTGVNPWGHGGCAMPGESIEPEDSERR